MSPLPEASDEPKADDVAGKSDAGSKFKEKAKSQPQSLSFSSSGSTSKTAAKKRKILGSADDAEPSDKTASKPTKKPKKAQRKLLSFGDDT